MASIFVSSVIVMIFGLSLYFALNERSHSQPFKLLLFAFFNLFIIGILQLSFDSLVEVLNKIDPNKPHFKEFKNALVLLNSIIGPFCGALIGTAVTNRALQLNSKRLEELFKREADCKVAYLDKANIIANELLNSDNSMPREVFMEKHKICQDLRMTYEVNIQIIRMEINKLKL